MLYPFRRRVFFATLGLGVLLSGMAFSQTMVANDWVTRRPPGVGFRILTPPDWELRTPRGPNIRLLVFSRQPDADGRPGFANCNVLVRAHPAIAGTSQAALDAEILSGPMSPEDASNAMSTLSNPILRENRVARIVNRPAWLVTAFGSYETVEARVSMVMTMATTFRNGRIYAITCGAGAASPSGLEASYAAWRPLLLSSMGTMVFED